MTIDSSNNGFGIPFNGFPHDCTEGTGVFPASGIITLANPALIGCTRKWLVIQNQSAASITIKFNAMLSDGITPSTVSMILASGGGIGTAGGSYENEHQWFSAVGVITITGAAGGQVLILERLK